MCAVHCGGFVKACIVSTSSQVSVTKAAHIPVTFAAGNDGSYGSGSGTGPSSGTGGGVASYIPGEYNFTMLLLVLL